MLESFYNSFGFIGALLISFLLFIFIIFWIAGLAGLTLTKKHRQAKSLQLIIAVLFPPYPLVWLVTDIIRQRREMSRT